MEKVASITKYESNEKLISWLSKLPQKYSVEYANKLLKIAKKASYLLWTKNHGIKMFR